MKSDKKVIILDAEKKYRTLTWNDIMSSKDLLHFLVVKELKVLYGQTYLGIGWVLLNPIINMIVLSIVFGRLAHIDSGNVPYPVFCLSGLLPWFYFSNSVTSAVNGLILNAKIISKVYFPRLFIPLTPIIAKLVDLLLGMCFLVIFMMFYSIPISCHLFLLPILFFILIITTAGVALWLSCLAFQYRDIKYAITFLFQLLIFISPVIFPASLVEQSFGHYAYLIYGLYPLTGVIEGFRSAFIGSQIPWQLLTASSIGAFISLLSGFFYFQLKEQKFADL